ncbi:MAG TPA: N-acetyl-gamma-glutamyl-phosphate reductase, partial [bacterium]|nr:N-acetyl-gamma-glutamyl-phosphate reductase [bacterium]
MRIPAGVGGGGVSARVSIIGASGYGGGELARLLVGHPAVELVHLTADTKAGEAM